jgi:hypothetical protein
MVAPANDSQARARHSPTTRPSTFQTRTAKILVSHVTACGAVATDKDRGIALSVGYSHDMRSPLTGVFKGRTHLRGGVPIAAPERPIFFSSDWRHNPTSQNMFLNIFFAHLIIRASFKGAIKGVVTY